MTDTDPTVQTALPLELPDYHGRPASGMKISLSGAGKRITRPHTLEDRVILVVEAKVKHAGHDATDEGILYVEKLVVADLFELEGDPGRRLLSTMRSLYRTGTDAAQGREQLPGMTVHTDASGVVLTEAELAQLRGDPVSAITSPDLTPAVVVYNDDTRELWPDDFPRDAIRPTIGTVIAYDDGTSIEVVDLLHHETGESMAASLPGLSNLTPTSGAGPLSGDVAGTDGENVPVSAGDIPDLPEPGAPGVTEPFALAWRVVAADGSILKDRDPGYVFEIADCFHSDAEGATYWKGADVDAEIVDDWETPDPATAAREEAARLASLPNSDDFTFVDRPVTTIIVEIDQITDTVHLTRLLTAERQGRGKAAKPRVRVEKAIGDRIAHLLDGDS